MAFSLLSAKLHKPQVSDKIMPRLNLLKACRDNQVILVSAQAGSGKSTIISAWLNEQNRPFSWYSLDEWDNDITQFFTYFTAAIQSIDMGVAKALEQLIASYQSIGFEAFVRTLVHQLHAIDQPYIMVLDDYHLIHNTQIHEVIKTLLSHLPQNMQFILITREDPPFPLAKLRANKGLFELRISELKFTEAEAKAFFKEQLDVTLKDEQLNVLIKKNEGWISGLQLTALSMQQLDNVSDFIEAFTGSHYYIMDYLMEEVLNNQPSEIKAFLLKTSIFEFFSAALCEAVVPLAPASGSTFIEKLLKTNCFIIPMDASRKWYRYHHLFKDILQQMLANTPEIDSNTLQVQAGYWFKNEGYSQEAIHHFLKGNAFNEAAALIECKWSEMDDQLQAGLWLTMAKQLPLAIIEKSPVLAIGYGWALLDTGDITGSEPWLDKAQALYEQYQANVNTETLIINDRLQLDLLPANLAAARGYSAATVGDMEGIFKHTHEALALIPSNQHKKYSLVSMLLALAYWGIGDLQKAERLVHTCLDNLTSAEMPIAYNSIYMVLGELYVLQGRLSEAQELFTQLIARVKQENTVPILLASLYLGLAKTIFLQGDVAQAYALLDDSKTYGQNYALMDWKYKYYLLLARIYCSEGFYDLSRDCLRESKAHYFMNPMPDELTFEDMEALINQAESATSASTQPNNADYTNNAFLNKEHANEALIESLTVRELEVLQLIASGLSNQEICNTLFLALSTVKSYNQTIYQKLQVKRRTEAVAKAKVLGLV